jgi:HK97 gp10 family phage protein
MSKGFEIEIQGLDNLMKIAEKYPRISEKHINKAINNTLIRIQDQAKKNAPSGDTQQLRQKWNIKMGRFEGLLESGARSGGKQYGMSIEYGLKAGHRIPVKNNPVFQLWATRRGLNPYAVAKSIEKKGTKAQPFFQPAIDSQKQNADNEFSKAMDKILKEI